jgi:hypothetical protein
VGPACSKATRVHLLSPHLRLDRPNGMGHSHTAQQSLLGPTWIFFSVRLSRLAVDSSKQQMAGSLSSARAMATRCFSPPDRRSPRSPTTVS